MEKQCERVCPVGFLRRIVVWISLIEAKRLALIFEVIDAFTVRGNQPVIDCNSSSQSWCRVKRTPLLHVTAYPNLEVEARQLASIPSGSCHLANLGLHRLSRDPCWSHLQSCKPPEVSGRALAIDRRDNSCCFLLAGPKKYGGTEASRANKKAIALAGELHGY